MKKFLTGEPQSCESKGEDEWEFEPEAVGLFNINDVPNLGDTLEAIESKWSIISFNKTYKPNPDPAKGELLADPRFKYDTDFLQTCVVSSFLNRVLAGCITIKIKASLPNLPCTYEQGNLPDAVYLSIRFG